MNLSPDTFIEGFILGALINGTVMALWMRHRYRERDLDQTEAMFLPLARPSVVTEVQLEFCTCGHPRWLHGLITPITKGMKPMKPCNAGCACVAFKLL